MSYYSEKELAEKLSRAKSFLAKAIELTSATEKLQKESGYSDVVWKATLRAAEIYARDTKGALKHTPYWGKPVLDGLNAFFAQKDLPKQKAGLQRALADLAKQG